MLNLKEEYATIVDVNENGYIEIHQTYTDGESSVVLLSKSQVKKIVEALPSLIEKLGG